MKFEPEEWYWHDDYGLIQYLGELDLTQNLENKNEWLSINIPHVINIFMGLDGKMLNLVNTANVKGFTPEEREFINKKKIELL